MTVLQLRRLCASARSLPTVYILQLYAILVRIFKHVDIAPVLSSMCQRKQAPLQILVLISVNVDQH
jgi:hypothetical protein